MRKWINIALIGCLLFITGKTFAANMDTDYGYVIVRCTVTVDVDVLDDQATAWFVAKGTDVCTLSPNQDNISISSISVKNNSNGAVVKYAVMVSSIQRSEDGVNWISDDDDTNRMIKGWYLSQDGTNESVGEFVLAAVFAKSRPTAFNEFGNIEANDRFLLNLAGGNPTTANRQTYTYKVNGDAFDPNITSTLRYPSALGNPTGTNAISPITTDGNNPRGLWFYIKTPEAVTDEYPRRIVIRVDAGLGNAW